jgi:hydroxymethylpyrimidine/phosphomethylpyrimidine kinase
VLAFVSAGKLKRMPRIEHRPVALTIAGSDSGGGAGVQADLKTFAALGVHGTSAVACITAQNPRRVLRVESCSPKILQRQIEAVFEELTPTAAKTGMLFSAENIHVVADFFQKNNRLPLIVDPVMVSTSGARLLKPAAVNALKERLLPLATLVTPNLREAEIFAGLKIANTENMRTAARKIYAHFGCAALVKGGHLPGVREAVDIFFDDRMEWFLSTPFIKGIRTHGTGCTYSAAITSYLARGLALPQAVKHAKEFVFQAIAGSYRIGKHFALNQQF